MVGNAQDDIPCLSGNISPNGIRLMNTAKRSSNKSGLSSKEHVPTIGTAPLAAQLSFENQDYSSTLFGRMLTQRITDMKQAQNNNNNEQNHQNQEYHGTGILLRNVAMVVGGGNNSNHYNNSSSSGVFSADDRLHQIKLKAITKNPALFCMFQDNLAKSILRYKKWGIRLILDVFLDKYIRIPELRDDIAEYKEAPLQREIGILSFLTNNQNNMSPTKQTRPLRVTSSPVKMTASPRTLTPTSSSSNSDRSEECVFHRDIYDQIMDSVGRQLTVPDLDSDLVSKKRLQSHLDEADSDVYTCGSDTNSTCSETEEPSEHFEEQVFVQAGNVLVALFK